MMVVANTSLFALRIKDRSWSRQISRRTSGLPASALVLNAAFSAAVLWAEPASGAYAASGGGMSADRLVVATQRLLAAAHP
jgi:hypothetical protein